MNRYFIFNGIKSDTKKIMIKNHPVITSSQLRDNSIVIEGRSGKLHYNQEIYDSFVRTLECAITDPTVDIRLITSWLKGSGEIIFSHEPDKFYRVNIMNQIDFVNIANQLYEFPLVLEFEPFAYEIEETVIEILNDCTININNANTKLFPIIKIYGDGDITLAINGKQQTVYDVNEFIELNSELEIAYKNSDNKNISVYGEYLCLVPGTNEISFTGQVQKIEISYRGAYI